MILPHHDIALRIGSMSLSRNVSTYKLMARQPSVRALPKHVPNAETHFDCPQAFLSLDF